MGQRINVELYDDIETNSPATQSVSFGWQGKSYEIDLNDKNFAQFEKAVTKYVEHARLVRKNGAGKPLREVKTGPDPRAVRAWAASQGITVNRLGKVPQEIVDQYHAAGN